MEVRYKGTYYHPMLIAFFLPPSRYFGMNYSGVSSKSSSKTKGVPSFFNRIGPFFLYGYIGISFERNSFSLEAIGPKPVSHGVPSEYQPGNPCQAVAVKNFFTSRSPNSYLLNESKQSEVRIVRSRRFELILAFIAEISWVEGNRDSLPAKEIKDPIINQAFLASRFLDFKESSRMSKYKTSLIWEGIFNCKSNESTKASMKFKDVSSFMLAPRIDTISISSRNVYAHRAHTHERC